VDTAHVDAVTKRLVDDALKARDERENYKRSPR
jgi:hypothetical protein